MLSSVPLGLLLGIGAVAALVILFAGLRMTDLADRIADRTGLGEAVVGGVLLGAATSFSGTIVSLTAALDGRASLAFSNGIGGIAAQHNKMLDASLPKFIGEIEQLGLGGKSTQREMARGRHFGQFQQPCGPRRGCAHRCRTGTD